MTTSSNRMIDLDPEEELVRKFDSASQIRLPPLLLLLLLDFFFQLFPCPYFSGFFVVDWSTESERERERKQVFLLSRHSRDIEWRESFGLNRSIFASRRNEANIKLWPRFLFDFDWTIWCGTNGRRHLLNNLPIDPDGLDLCPFYQLYKRDKFNLWLTVKWSNSRLWSASPVADFQSRSTIDRS